MAQNHYQSGNPAVIEAIRKVGGQVPLARLIGCSQTTVSQYVAGKRIPAERAVAIERATGVHRRALRPDIFEY